jgi:hypothetical protein
MDTHHRARGPVVRPASRSAQPARTVGAAALCWTMIEPHTLIVTSTYSQVKALKVTPVSGLHMAFRGEPLVKVDG